MVETNSHLSREDENHETLYGVSQETIRELEEALEEGNKDAVQHLISPLHTADVAVVIEYISPQLRDSLIELLRPQFDPYIFTHLNEIVREEVIEQLGTRDTAEAIGRLKSDDAVALIEDLEEDQQRKILEYIPLSDRVILEEVLTYPEDSAARLMQREIVCVPNFWTVDEALKYMTKESDLPEKFYDLFVVDPKHVPIGGVPLSLLLRQPPSTKIIDIMLVDIKKIPATMDQEDVALLF
ncbi:MAG: magnesium transporter, partial [Alphaproteobacteria bacterium]|nr:magnesium transporter [Alphaproteobacteria bacterium]